MEVENWKRKARLHILFTDFEGEGADGGPRGGSTARASRFSFLSMVASVMSAMDPFMGYMPAPSSV